MPEHLANPVIKDLPVNQNSTPSQPVFKAIANSPRVAHSTVSVQGVELGEVWKEHVQVTVSSFTQPRRTAMKWRWFSRRDPSSPVCGKNTRTALLLGAGFRSRAEAFEELQKFNASQASLQQGDA